MTNLIENLHNLLKNQTSSERGLTVKSWKTELFECIKRGSSVDKFIVDFNLSTINFTLKNLYWLKTAIFTCVGNSLARCLSLRVSNQLNAFFYQHDFRAGIFVVMYEKGTSFIRFLHTKGKPIDLFFFLV